jgi:hypothetical protein
MTPEASPPFNAYTFAFSFWSLLTTEREDLEGGITLANLETPFLLSNAAWYPKADELKPIAKWYAKRGLPPALVVPSVRDEDTEHTLQESAFTLEKTFGFIPIQTSSLIRLTNHAVEQASWLQSRVTAELLATHFGQAEFAVGMSQTLVRAMQSQQSIRIYLVYEDKPIAAMVTFEQNSIIAAMLISGSNLFTRTLLQEATILGLEPFTFELSDGLDVNISNRLERWSIQ